MKSKIKTYKYKYKIFIVYILVSKISIFFLSIEISNRPNKKNSKYNV